MSNIEYPITNSEVNHACGVHHYKFLKIVLDRTVNMCIVAIRTVFANTKVNITKRNVPNVTCGKPKLVRSGRKCYANPLIQGCKIETGE